MGFAFPSLSSRARQGTASGVLQCRTHAEKGVVAGKGQILLCGTCMDARGLTDAEMMAGAQRSSMAELAAATLEADKVLVF